MIPIVKLPSSHCILRTDRSAGRAAIADRGGADVFEWLSAPSAVGLGGSVARPEVSIAGASAVQPFGELLLQICCRCSRELSEVQFLIAVEEDHGACLGGVVQLLCHKFRFSLSSGGSKMSR
jgi:hypothetical protein